MYFSTQQGRRPIWAVSSYVVLASLIVILSCIQPGSQGRTHTKSQTIHQSNRSSVVIRVLLLKDNRVTVSSQSGLTVIDLNRNTNIAQLPENQSLRIQRSGSHWQLFDQKNNLIQATPAFAGDQLQIVSHDQSTLNWIGKTKRTYHGSFTLTARTDGRFDLVNSVDIEDYLAGVVGSEMPASWDKKALQAQAIACRTYALYEMHGRQGRRNWDVTDDQQSQVYRGAGKIDRRVKEVLEDTRGVVLAYGPAGKEKIFPTFFSSTCGGHTQDSIALIEDSLAPLKGTACPYCKTTNPKYYRWNPLEIPKKVVSDRLINSYPKLKVLKEIKDIQLLEQSGHGRLERLQLIGSNGRAATLKAESFRLAVSHKKYRLRSSWYKLYDAGINWRFTDGQGWGHGVGLCQYGSRGMARQGHDCVSILSHYYPKSQLVRAY